MNSAFVADRVSGRLPHEAQRGMDFARLLEGHDRHDPKLMGGAMGADGTYQALGSKATDREWIAQSRRRAFENYLSSLLDQGGPGAVLHLKDGTTRAACEPGKNMALVEEHWNDIDWSHYNMWECLHELHVANVVNYKICMRTSKAGLEFQTTVRDRDVHFLLETFLKGNNMDAVVNKSGARGRSITAGELRWLYRNWENPRVSLRTAVLD